MKIRILTRNEWQSWKVIRLEALKNCPESFGSSFEEESNWSDKNFQETLDKNNVFGAFYDNQLIGCAAFYCLGSMKTKHRGILWGMYIKAECRGKGFADNLIQSIITTAKTKVMQLHLTCVTSNLSAIKFYERNGFKSYGVEPRSLMVGEKFYDESLMVLKFD